MVEINKKLCVFIHFWEKPYFPKHVEIFIKELTRFFDEVILISNDRPIQSSKNVSHPNVRLVFVRNEGYDLGMFYKALQTIKMEDYSQIACINDSNILFNSLAPVFDWAEKQQLDFWGLIDCYQKPWFSTHEDSYHIQSHFLVFNKKAIDLMPVFFKSIEMEKIFQEKELKNVRQAVINKWEIGLTQFLKKRGLHIGSFIDSKEFSKNNDIKKKTNLSHSHYFRLIKAGYPLIKKKVIFDTKFLKCLLRPKIRWDNMMFEYGNPDWDIVGLVEDFRKLKRNM